MRCRLFWAALAAAGCAFPQTKPDPLAAATANDVAAGKRVYDSQCALCHGIGGTGGRGPAFNVPKLSGASNGQELIGVILGGVNGTGMPSFWFLGEKPVFQVAAYVHSLGAAAEATTVAGDREHGKALFKSNG